MFVLCNAFIWIALVNYCMKGRWERGLVHFYKKGRQERGWVHSGGVSSRMLRIARYPAATLWLWTVAAPNCFSEYQAILNILPKPPPECTHPLSRLFFASAAKRARYGLFAVLERVWKIIPVICTPHFAVNFICFAFSKELFCTGSPCKTT